MATTPVTVQVSTIGTDCGPFTIADNVTGTIITGVSRTTLLSGIVVSADDTATDIIVSSGGVCTGASIDINIAGIVCPPTPPPDYSYWLAHYYPCDGFCESPGDVVVAFPSDYTPNYTKWYRGPEFIYRIYDVATAPYDIYLSDTTEYTSCLTACSETPPPPTYEWYQLTNCITLSVINSQNYTPGTFNINDRVYNLDYSQTYYVSAIYTSNPGGIQIGIIATGSTGCSAYYYYSGLLCGGGTTEYFRSTDPNLSDHAAVVKVYSSTLGGTEQCFDNITPSSLVSYNDIIAIYDDCTICSSAPPSSVTWQVTNDGCGYGVIYDVGINGYYMNTLDGPSTFPLTSTLYGTKLNPNGINYSSSDNAITAHVTTNLPGNGNCGIMYLIFNGAFTARYEQTFHSSPFVTISGVYIQVGDQVEVRISCYEGACP